MSSCCVSSQQQSTPHKTSQHFRRSTAPSMGSCSNTLPASAKTSCTPNFRFSRPCIPATKRVRYCSRDSTDVKPPWRAPYSTCQAAGAGSVGTDLKLLDRKINDAAINGLMFANATKDRGGGDPIDPRVLPKAVVLRLYLACAMTAGALSHARWTWG